MSKKHKYYKTTHFNHIVQSAIWLHLINTLSNWHKMKFNRIKIISQILITCLKHIQEDKDIQLDKRSTLPGTEVSLLLLLFYVHKKMINSRSVYFIGPDRIFIYFLNTIYKLKSIV